MEVFDDEWRIRRVDALAPVAAGSIDARVGWKVQTGKRMFATFVDVVETGRLVAVIDVEDADDPDIWFELPQAVFEAIQTGELDVVVAYMRGDLRLVGDRAAFFALAPTLRSAPYVDALGDVASSVTAPSTSGVAE